jgi:hypothetical protein
MELYIQIKHGQPFQHPIFGDNFREAFSHIDINNLPPEFARFERVECPNNASTFEVDVVSYQWVNGVVKDVWAVRSMTEEEKTKKLEELTESVLARCRAIQDVAQEKFASAPTETQKQAWANYLVQLSTWVLVDPTNPKFPAPPSIAADGTVLLTTASGASPNVIG